MMTTSASILSNSSAMTFLNGNLNQMLQIARQNFKVKKYLSKIGEKNVIIRRSQKQKSPTDMVSQRAETQPGIADVVRAEQPAPNVAPSMDVDPPAGLRRRSVRIKRRKLNE